MVQADPIWKKFLGTAVDAIGRCLYGFLRNTGLLKNQRPELRNIQPKRILVIRTDSLGDVLLTTPLFRALKQKYPKTKVCALVRQGFREVLADNPHVDQIITHDVPWGKERSPWPVKIRIFCSWKTLTYPLKLIRIICLLRAQQFDLGIELNGDLRNILFFLVAVKIPNRLGFNRTGGEYLLAGSVEYNIYENQIKNNARLIYKLGIDKLERQMEIFISPQVKSEVKALLKKNGIENGERLVVIHPGGKKIQRWPPENFAHLGKKLLEEFNVKLLLTGTEADLGLKSRMEPYLNGSAVSLVGKTSIRQLAALLSQNALLICNDTGVMHIASAVNCKTLAVFGPTNPQAFAHPNVEVMQMRPPCKPNTHERCSRQNDLPGACMREMTVDFVYEKVKAYFDAAIVS